MWQAVEFVSDLHLDSEHPATLRAFAHYLHTTQADAVFLLGDVFEVWPGDDAIDERGSFERHCCALLARAARLRAIYCMHGNRDFLLGQDLRRCGAPPSPQLLSRQRERDFFLPSPTCGRGAGGEGRADICVSPIGIGFTRHCRIPVLNDPTVLFFMGQRWLLSHGDALCLGDVEYQHFRRQVRNPQWQAALLARPLHERRAFAVQARNQSQARKDSGTTHYADVDTQAALQWLHATDCHALIHGHTHRPADHRLNAHHTRHVLTDWDMHATPPRAEILRLSATGLQRLPLTPP